MPTSRQTDRQTDSWFPESSSVAWEARRRGGMGFWAQVEAEAEVEVEIEVRLSEVDGWWWVIGGT